jgi:hypothetical protein
MKKVLPILIGIIIIRPVGYECSTKISWLKLNLLKEMNAN